IQVRTAGPRVTQMLALPGGDALCVSDASGDSVFFDTSSWLQTSSLHTEVIHDIAAAADSRMVALVARDGTVHLGARHNRREITWTSLAGRARRVAFTRDGLLIAICTDGATWLYSPIRRAWLYLVTGTAQLNQLVLDDAEATAFVFDANGQILAIDLIA